MAQFNGYLDIKNVVVLGQTRGLGNMGRVQKFVDSECIRLMAPYTPFKNGVLEKSATIGTVIGSGEIVQSTPYARYQYYGRVYGPNIPIYQEGTGDIIGWFSPKGQKKYPTSRLLHHKKAKHPKAGPFWFDRMKADHKDDILNGARKVAGI